MLMWTDYYPKLVLLLAVLLDFLIGDPWDWWHPVQGMGWFISRYSQVALHWLKSPIALRGAGVVLGLGLIGGSGLLGWGLVAIAQRLHLGLGLGLEVILLASCFAGRSLRRATEDVLAPLKAGNLIQARQQLSMYVGRDTENLTEPEVLRAVLETVAENSTDGVLAPLFYALVGAALPGIGSLPLALAYKAASTLDSMVGYKQAPYTDLGWFSAKADDLLTWLPCRLVVLTLALGSGRPLQVWRLCQQDAPQDPSPNSGWSEGVYAAVLEVQLGGTNWYRGIAKFKPLLGKPSHAIAPADIRRALQLTQNCCLLWVAIALVILRLLAIYQSPG